MRKKNVLLEFCHSLVACLLVCLPAIFVAGVATYNQAQEVEELPKMKSILEVPTPAPSRVIKIEPVVKPVDSSNDQIEELIALIEALTARVDMLERKLSKAEKAIAPETPKLAPLLPQKPIILIPFVEQKPVDQKPVHGSPTIERMFRRR